MNLSLEAFQAIVLELEETKLREIIRRYPSPSPSMRPNAYRLTGAAGRCEVGAAEAALELVQKAQAELRDCGSLSVALIEKMETRMRAREMLIESWQRLQAKKSFRPHQLIAHG